MKCERTKKGFPAIWEAGGSATNTGWARIVADKNGQPKRPLFVVYKGHRSNSNHALIPVSAGDYIVYATHARGNVDIRVYSVKGFSPSAETNEMVVEKKLIGEMVANEWVLPAPEKLAEAAKAAQDKVLCYHCRTPHYVKE